MKICKVKCVHQALQEFIIEVKKQKTKQNKTKQKTILFTFSNKTNFKKSHCVIWPLNSMKVQE